MRSNAYSRFRRNQNYHQRDSGSLCGDRRRRILTVVSRGIIKIEVLWSNTENSEANDNELIRKYGDLLRAGTNNKIIEKDNSLGINFDFQSHKIDDLAKEFGRQMHPSRISHNEMAVITAGSGVRKIKMHRFDIGECLLMIIPSWCIHTNTD
jgi:hypothetical protein